MATAVDLYLEVSVSILVNKFTLDVVLLLDLGNYFSFSAKVLEEIRGGVVFGVLTDWF